MALSNKPKGKANNPPTTTTTTPPPATTPKKIARRQVMRIDGKLQVVFIDVATNKVLQNLDGYTIASGDNGGTYTPPPTTNPPPSSGGGGGGGQAYDGAQDYSPWGESTYKPSKGSGNIFADFDKAKQSLIDKVDAAKEFVVPGSTGRVNKETGLTNIPPFDGSAAKPRDPSTIADPLGGTKPAWGATRPFEPQVTPASAPASNPSGKGLGQPTWIPAAKFEGSYPNMPTGELARNVNFNPDTIATRSMGVDRTLATDLAAILNATDPTLRMEINSGGQPSYSQGGKDGVNRVSGGTVNHDIKVNGETLVVDVQIFDAKGNQLTPASHPEVFGRLAQNAVIAGFTQIGMGQDKTHLGKDPADTRVRSWGYPSGSPPKLVQEGIRLGQLELQRSGTSRYVKMVAAVAGNVSGPQVPVPTIRGGANVAATSGVKPSAASALPGVGGLVSAMAGLKAAVGDNTPLVATPAINPASYTPTSSTGDLLSSLPPVKGGRPSIDYMPVDTNAAPRSSSLDTAWGVPTPFSGKTNQTTANPTPNPVVNASYNPGFAPKLPPGQSEAPSNFNAREYVKATTGFDPDAAIKQSYLDVLNKAEGQPSANTLFGYDTFDDLSTHPNTKVWYNNGEDFSTAAGLYQINKATWDEFSAKTGVTDFSEESQKKVGWAIAEANYAKNTGRDLLADLKSGNTQQIMDAFTGNANRWASLPGGKQPTTNINELVKEFNEGLKNRIETDFTPDASIAQGGGMVGSGLGGMSRPGIDISPGSASSGGSTYNSPTAVAGGLVPGLGGFMSPTSSSSGTGSVASRGASAVGSGSSGSSGSSGTGSVAANGLGGSSAVRSGASAVGSGSSGSSSSSGTGSQWDKPPSSSSSGTRVTGGSSAVGSSGLGGSRPSSAASAGSGAVGSGAPRTSGSQTVTNSSGQTMTQAQRDAISRL